MNSFLETLKQLGPARLGIMGAVLLGLLIFFIFVSMQVSTPRLELLYADLSSTDSGAIAARLEEAEIRYDVSPDGSRILVPDGEIGRARMLLAEAGLPNGGSMGYELFDQQSGFGTTNEIININKVRALEGELERTISSLDPVQAADVMLVLPERKLFSRESQPASASVKLKVNPGSVMEQSQIVAIQSLVASAVPQLQAKNVTIIDQNSNLLARGGDDDESLMASRTEDRRRKFERDMENKIESLVSKVVGFGKVEAIVTADLNFDRISTNEELYDPQTQVARSTQTIEENNTERDSAANNVSVENNLPAVGNDLFLDPKPAVESNRIEEVTNYEISRTTRSVVREVGEVKKLSVAVLVDGNYITSEEGLKEYQALPEEDLDAITELVRSAIGYDAVRGDTLEVRNKQFVSLDDIAAPEDDTILGFEKSDLLDTAQIVFVVIALILVVLLVLQPMIGRLLATEDVNLDDGEIDPDLLAARPMNPALEGPSQEFQPAQVSDDEDESMINMQSVEGKVKASSVKKVEDIVDAYPTETVSVLRSWMTQES